MENQKISEDEVKLVEVPADLIDEVSWTTARAYIESPAYKWVFDENEDTRLYQMKVLFAAYFGMLQGSEKHATRCFIKEEVNEVGETVQTVVCSFLLLNTKYPPSTWAKIRNGLLKLPFIYGISLLLKLLKLGEDLDGDVEEVTGGRECMKLERMIVNPRFQGQGIGSKWFEHCAQGGQVQGFAGGAEHAGRAERSVLQEVGLPRWESQGLCGGWKEGLLCVDHDPRAGSK